jgi:hypothetical protein
MIGGILMFNTKVTLFNEFKKGSVSVFLPTMFENAEIQETQGRNISKTGLQDANKAMLYIMENSLPSLYLKPKEWQKQSQEEAMKTFTLKAKGNDFFVCGEYVEIIQNKEKFCRENNGVYTVSTVDIYKELLPHFEIGGM